MHPALRIPQPAGASLAMPPLSSTGAHPLQISAIDQKFLWLNCASRSAVLVDRVSWNAAYILLGSLQI
jgi:hypothetical protein